MKDVILRLVYESIMHFEGHLKAISMVSDELEHGISTSVTNQQLLNMFTLEKSLVFYINAIRSNGHLIEKMKVNAAKLSFSTAHAEFLDDLSIENTQCFEMAEIHSQVLSSLMDARASVISNNLNVMMKNLSALVIAVAVPSFFAGVGGMSEFSGMIGFQNWRVGYLIFVAAMVSIGLTTFVVIKKLERYWMKI
jgi:magnesium transporter